MEFGFWSVVPPILTIVLAFLTKNVFISLLLGIFTGSMILSGWSLFEGINATFYSFVHTFESNSNVIVMTSMLLIGAVIYLVERTGGIQGFEEVIIRRRGTIRSKRGAGVMTWLLGIATFTSATISCMVTGSVSRPINDAMKVPHEKAAFIVHATSTPFCLLLPLSGWLASMTGYLTAGGVEEDAAINVLIQSIGLNFYCILAVAGTLLVCLLNLNIGPMKQAELRAETTGALDEPGHGMVAAAEAPAAGDVKPRLANMLAPIGVLIVTILAVLTVTGQGNPTAGSGMQALLWGSILSVLTLAVMCVAEKLFTVNQVIDEIFRGMSTMLPIAAILLFGFTMGSMVKTLDTGNYLTSLFVELLTPGLLPALTFLLCLILSFATGTSMGTMSIMSVICLPMALNLGVSVPLVAGAMFGGSVFGDHASPISDTTVMSCATTGCNIIDHVRTQTPYCILYAVISIVLYLVLGFLL